MLWENRSKVRESDVNFGPNCFTKSNDDPFFLAVVDSFAGRLFDEGYIAMSNNYCLVCRPPKDWLHQLAASYNNLPIDYLDNNLQVAESWKHIYCSQFGERKTVHPQVYHAFKKLLRE